MFFERTVGSHPSPQAAGRQGPGGPANSQFGSKRGPPSLTIPVSRGASSRCSPRFDRRTICRPPVLSTHARPSFCEQGGKLPSGRHELLPLLVLGPLPGPSNDEREHLTRLVRVAILVFAECLVLILPWAKTGLARAKPTYSGQNRLTPAETGLSVAKPDETCSLL